VHFLRAEGRSDLRLARSVWRALQAWSWPGNVRELQAEVRRWTVFCDEEVHLDDLAPEIRAGAPAPGPAPRVAVTHERTLAEVVADAEAAAVRAALAATGGNRSAAARRLDIDRHTLARKVAALGLEGS
jgi:two-component system response regulator AtoC